jgi:hypothetical protein
LFHGIFVRDVRALRFAAGSFDTHSRAKGVIELDLRLRGYLFCFS